ncbi:hypothetical protein [Flagellimonas flava]|uniref:Uncharacterized protein n=1 Tax=Flagellimonas flava TaxID=570519 RepID=A0A1M5M0K4_9FLAO|nr:hypothetical protein [Allomuricauda flava]SHG70459.1 hypothetical protein SAMN04488116_2181 [Allomuricauda flava]
MKKNKKNLLELNKKVISNLSKENLRGGTWTFPTFQTGCNTGNTCTCDGGTIHNPSDCACP